jgi:hypothetical protein
VRAQRRTRDETPDHTLGATPSRIVELSGGMRWRASLVARLISEDVAAGRESARLVLRLECLSARRRPLRAAVPGARALTEVSERTLRDLVARPARHRRRSLVLHRKRRA